MDGLLDFVHLLGAAIWLGGLATLAVTVVVAQRSLDRDVFRLLIRRTGRAFAVLSIVAWLLLAVSGLALAARHGWPQLAVVKAVVGGGILLAAAAHVLTGMRPGSRALIVVSRMLATLIFAATIAVFWLGVRLAG